MARTRIIVSGVMNDEEAARALEAGADAIGFDFFKASERYLDPGEAYELVAGLPPLAGSVGMFRDPELDEFCDIEEQCPTTLSLFTGNEAEWLVKRCGPGVMRTFRASTPGLGDELAKWNEVEELDGAAIDVSGVKHFDALEDAMSLYEKHFVVCGGTVQELRAAALELDAYGVVLPITTDDLESACRAIVQDSWRQF